MNSIFFLLGLGVLSAQGTEPTEANIIGYPNPPWARSVWASGNGFNKSSAQMLCQSDARSKVMPFEATCRTHGGAPTSNYPFCSLCNQLGSGWRCTDTISVYCNGHLEWEVDGAPSTEEILDEELDSTIGEKKFASPVFSDRQDCHAIIMNNPGLCRNRDCRGVLFHAKSICQSNDCLAIVGGLVNHCQTNDCRAVIFKNIGFCESDNCRAVIFKNVGLCR